MRTTGLLSVATAAWNGVGSPINTIIVGRPIAVISETMFSVHTYSIQQTRSVRITVAFRTGLAAISGIAGDQPRFRKTVRMAAAPMAIPTLRDRNGETPLIF